MYLIIQYIVTFSVCVPIFIGLLKKVQRRTDYSVVLLLLFISLAIEVIDFIRIKYNDYNALMSNLFTILEFGLLWFFYNRYLGRIGVSRINVVIIILFLLVAFVDLFYVNGFKQLNNITITVEAIMLLIYALFSFYIIMSKMLFDDLLQAPFFWINIAVLFYFSGSLFLFLFSNYLMNQGYKVYMEMYKIHTFVNAVWYLFISIGFWKVKKA